MLIWVRWIAACCAAGRPPVVVILTDGSGSHAGSREYPKARLIALRAAEVTEAVGILGLPSDRLMFLHQPDTQAPHAGPAFDAIVDLLADYAAVFGCSTILVPWLGDPHCDPSARAHECPVHEVALDPFFASKYEMTQGQWLRATRRNPSKFRPETGFSLLHPVELVSLAEARIVLARLGLELPSEAQWEYLARGGFGSRRIRVW